MREKLVTDLLVAGGGPAGLSAALAAARAGVKVILVQDRPVLGGNASSEVRMHIVGADGVFGERGREMSVESREGGLIEEIRLDACVHNPQLSSSVFDLILYDKCRKEPNLTLMLNTTVTGAVMKEGKIAAALAERLSTEQSFVIEAGLFMDCTGDGRLALEAGAKFRHGREAGSEFEESLAHHEADGKTLGSTLLFMASQHDRPMPFKAPAWARKFTENDLKLREHSKPGSEYGLEYGYWWLEWGGELNTIRQNEEIRDELMAILLGVWDHVKNGGDHGAANWALQWCGFLPGKRESRRFEGEVLLTQHDVMGSTAWPDAIAYGGWPIDTHPPGGVDAIDEPPCLQNRVPHLYDIPLRACVSKDVPNLMFAGRNFSATHIAFASTRVMATCSAVGEGAGAAAALCLKEKIQPGTLAADPARMARLQQYLLRQDCFLIGIPRADALDLAPAATCRASSSRENCGPEWVLSETTRCVDGKEGVPPGRTSPGPHRWISQPGLPAWLELRWENPVELGAVQLIFDTGLHRLLTFSLARGVNDRMHWGKGAPETAKDYDLEVELADGTWKKVLSVEGNHQRRRRHVLPAIETTRALRITITATHGADEARVVEVRAYRSELDQNL